MVVGDVMSKKVTTVKPDTSLRELWKTIFTRKVNAVPVVDAKGTMLGIITKDDILRLLYPNYEDLMEGLFSSYDFEEMENRIHELNAKKARDLMCKRVIYTREDTPIMRALSRMISKNVNQLPVLSRTTDKLVGIVAKGDIFRALFKKHLTHFPPLTKRRASR
ncbi:CBS domain-containing protein [Candidatus Gottesmanbacteria bacterium]|nr:CBS domain-containing protein [Candidatus Gottesmanbacteria bacterium]